MSAFIRFLTNYEVFLITGRLGCTAILLLHVFVSDTRSFDQVILASYGYYLATSLLMYAVARKQWERRFQLWYAIIGCDLFIVSAMVYTHGGFYSDLYYYYYLTMGMAARSHRWRASINLSFTALVNVLYLITLLAYPGAVAMSDLVLRMAFFFAVSTVFPMLSYLEYQKQEAASESTRLSEEKEQLVREMDSMNRQVAEYAFDLHNKAVLDQLTQLYNHNYFQSHILIEVEKAKQEGRPLSLLVLDLDSFKKINDTHGHPVGDQVLIGLSRRLGELVKGTYFAACRMGGEEFAVLMPDTSIDEGYAFAEQVRMELALLRFPLTSDAPLAITVSIGVASFPIHGASQQQLIESADQAMYVAKRTGKNRTCRYESTIAEPVVTL